MHSIEYLRYIVENDAHIIFDKGNQDADNPQELISISGPSLLTLPRDIFDGFHKQAFLEQECPLDGNGRGLFHLTVKGRRAGHTAATALKEMSSYIAAHNTQWSTYGHGAPAQPETEEKTYRIIELGEACMDLSRTAASQKVDYADFGKILAKLHSEIFFPPDHLVTHIRSTLLS